MIRSQLAFFPGRELRLAGFQCNEIATIGGGEKRETWEASPGVVVVNCDK